MKTTQPTAAEAAKALPALKNPVTAAREARGLKRAEMALLTGKTLSAISSVENAYLTAMPEAWRPAFEDAGFDWPVLAKAYLDFKAQRMADLKAGLARG